MFGALFRLSGGGTKHDYKRWSKEFIFTLLAMYSLLKYLIFIGYHAHPTELVSVNKTGKMEI